MARRWKLYVDESYGKTTAAAVAGFLVDERWDLNSATFRRTLQRIVPGAPWPLHMAYLRRPVMYVLWWQAALPRDRNHHPLHDTCAQVAALLGKSALAASYEACLNRVQAGGAPDFDTVQALELEVGRFDRTLLNQLQEQVQATSAGLDRVFASLVREAGTDVHGAPQQTVIVAAETAPRAAARLSEDDDLYLTFVETLFERAADVVARIPGDHEIRAYVLTRDIHDPALKVRAPLHFRHLAPLARRSRVVGERVRVIVDDVPEYDSLATCGLVYADAFAWRSMWATDNPVGSARTVETDIAGRTGATLHSGVPIASHLSASGAARQYVDAGRVGDAQPPLEATPSRRRWAVDQAREWTAVFAEPLSPTAI